MTIEMARLTLLLNGVLTFISFEINIQILETTHKITMFAEKMSIMQSKLMLPLSSPNTFEIYNELIGHLYDYDRNMFNIYFNEKLLPGYYILNVIYTSSMFNDGGFQRIFSKERVM